MNTTIHERKFPNRMSGVCDGSVAGTHFYNDDTGEEMWYRLVLPCSKDEIGHANDDNRKH